MIESAGVLSGRLISDDFIVISVTVLRSYPVLGYGLLMSMVVPGYFEFS